MKAVENVVYKGRILAVVLRAHALQELQDSGKNISFSTPEHFPLQMGMQVRPKGDIISVHFHKPFQELKNLPVQEFLYIKSGKIKVDLYEETENDAKVSEVTVGTGDTILLNTGHGLTFLEKTELIELKQGPYRGRDEEKRFVGSDNKLGGK